MSTTLPTTDLTARRHEIHLKAQPPFWTAASSAATESTLHQLAPYLGKMKSSIASALLDRFALNGGAILDPFCGSGSVLLEAALRGRRTIGIDWNSYAHVISRAKVTAPLDRAKAERRLYDLWARAQQLRRDQDLRRVPTWVRGFFHKETLRDALAFRDACVEADETFYLACLLSILHHQRPGFLSYPASHLVPYLRTFKFPRVSYPELYRHREVLPRLKAKVMRALRRVPTAWHGESTVILGDTRLTVVEDKLGAVITSPPYMNELDYVRDNRLRLWMVDRSLPKNLELPAQRRETLYYELIRKARENFCSRLGVGGYAVFVVGEVTRRRRALATAALTDLAMSERTGKGCFVLDQVFLDQIPVHRRVRRGCRGTRVETVLAYKRTE